MRQKSITSAQPTAKEGQKHSDKLQYSCFLHGEKDLYLPKKQGSYESELQRWYSSPREGLRH